MEPIFGLVGVLLAVVGGVLGYVVAMRKRSEMEQSLSLALIQKAQLEEQIKAAKQVAEDEPRRLALISERMNTHFQSLANQILEKKSEALKEKQSHEFANILGPLQENLKAFKHQVERSHADELRDRTVLREEMKRMQTASFEMQKQADLLTQALKGDVRSQGAWGELVLERVLEYSGLSKGRDYILQGEGMGLRTDSGKLQKPDVVVQLPGGKHIIIDSKVTLEPYRRLLEDENQSIQQDFVKSLKSHVDNLAGKQYFRNEKIISPEFVFLFFPIEGALSKAIELQDDLIRYGWEKSVVIVTPANLIATLKTVASLWRVERQNKNASDIAKEAGMLYEKFVGFTEDLDDLGRSLERANESFDNGYKKLKTGRGNIFTKIDKLKILGAKTAKELPPEALTEAKGSHHESTQ